MSAVINYEDAIVIQPAERDSQLLLETSSWTDRLTAGWECVDGCPQRTIEADDKEVAEPPSSLATSLRESILRFPSAPIHGVQRLHEYHSNLPESQSLHTYRVLTAPESAERISRIFLFHNGLNELDRMGLYYQLASHLIAEDPGVACILRPFPGHLTRAPFSDFPENPLHRYLWDGSHLFRQFLRHMTETQWFLSAIVKRSRYPCLSGAALLAEGLSADGTRLDPEVLTDAMLAAWLRLHKSSKLAGGPIRKYHPDAPSLTPPPEREVFADVVRSLRNVLKLEAYQDLGPSLQDSDAEPSVHVIGYSLGGFAAQSVFMSWPFVIDSCSTLLSGGALRELSPTAFANPEEWQTVLHSLRYELDDGMLDGRFSARKKEVAGLKKELFLHFQRTFYEVFQQEYRGSFRTRLEAFRQRMLFIVGGDDPIVRPQSVLDSGPPGGINLLEIGGIGHFLGSRAKDSDEEEQRRFWLPEIGRLIERFSIEAARRHKRERPSTWLDEQLNMHQPEPAGQLRVMSLREQDVLDLPQDGALPGKLFGLCLDDLLARQRDIAMSRLLVSRNEVPTVLLDRRAVQRRARALLHDDLSIVNYCRGIQTRWEALQAGMRRTRLILPWNAARVHRDLDPAHAFPSQSETAVGHMPKEITREEAWSEFGVTCAALADSAPGSISVFDGREPLVPYGGMPERAHALVCTRGDAHDGAPVWVPSLPDCWIWMSPGFLGVTTELSAREADERLIAQVQNLYADDPKKKLEELAQSLHREELRIITVSRARYNPRFRGQLVIDVRAVKQILTHVALCTAVAYDFTAFDLNADTPAPRTPRR